jgi:putative ABC transport system permease protein
MVNNNVDTTGAAPLSFLQLSLALLAPISIYVISIYLKLDFGHKILISVFRTIVQLLLAGYVLLSFIFSIQSPYIVITYLFVMAMIASLEVMTRQTRTYKGQYFDSLCAILMGGAVMGAYGTVVVFNPKPWWNPQVMVPTTGMIIGSAISGPSLAVERFDSIHNLIFLQHVTKILIMFLEFFRKLPKKLMYQKYD